MLGWLPPLLLTIFLISPNAWSFGRSRAPAVTVEDAQSAILSGDATGIVEGCAHAGVGFAYCRFPEGPVDAQALSFVGPPADCVREDACVFVQIRDAQGRIAWGGQIDKGKTRVLVPWRKILGCQEGPAAPCEFHQGQRGVWSFVHEVHWKDAEGRDRRSTSLGDLMLRIYKRDGYAPLDTVEADPAFTWNWTDGGRIYRMTTGLRAFVGMARQ